MESGACWDSCRVDPSVDFSGINWVFGYGSLCWKPPCDDALVVRSFPAEIRGFVRRLWISSSDHRGTLACPGLVAALLPGTHVDVDDVPVCEQVVCGRVYEIADIGSILPTLDFRERHGYTRTLADIYASSCHPPGRLAADAAQLISAPLGRAIVYVVDPAHCPAYSGRQPAAAVAATVAVASGPSGSNADYVLRLRQHARDMGTPCAHLEEVGGACEALLETAAGGVRGGVDCDTV